MLQSDQSGVSSESVSRFNPPRVGYVVKRYPRYSETFIVNEILAHEAAGLDLEIFTLFPTCDTHFQDCISKVRAPVHYLTSDGQKASDLWAKMQTVVQMLPGGWSALEAAVGLPARELNQALTLGALVLQRRITHLHAHFATSATAVARVASRLTDVPYTFTAHAKDIYHESADADDLCRKFTDAAAVVTVSDYNMRYLQQRLGPAAEHVRRVYNGLHLNDLQFHSPAERDPLIIAVGRLVEKKGFDVLVEACGILRCSGCHFHCRIIGDGEEAPRLRQLIEDLALGPVVELVGPRPQAQVFEQIRRGAVLAAPCVVGSDGNRDGMPTVLLEAMALGTACISADVTGIGELVQDEVTGLMVPQRDAHALAKALRRLLDEPELRVRLALQARRLIEREFDIDRNAAMIRQLFQPAPNQFIHQEPALAMAHVREAL